MRYISRARMAEGFRSKGVPRRSGSEKIPKAHILLTIVFTSLVWFLLDVFLFATQDSPGAVGPGKFPVFDTPSHDHNVRKRAVLKHQSDTESEDDKSAKIRRVAKLKEWRESLERGGKDEVEKQEKPVQVEHVELLENRMVKEESELRPQSFKELHNAPAAKKPEAAKEHVTVEVERDNNVHQKILEEKPEERPKSFQEIQDGALLATTIDTEGGDRGQVGQNQSLLEDTGHVNKHLEEKDRGMPIDFDNKLVNDKIILSKRNDNNIVQKVSDMIDIDNDSIDLREVGISKITEGLAREKTGNFTTIAKALERSNITAHNSDTIYFEKVRNRDVSSSPRTMSQPGEGGRGVILNPEQQQIAKQLWNRNHFNVFASDQISLERSVPDPRPNECKVQQFPYAQLPSTSIIICFTDEAWSTLLRSVHSVLNRSPPELVEEVILVDDFSKKEHLKEKLDKYVRNLPKVKILRMAKREGLIRARLAAVEVAKGEVITFLDSHIECNVGWLEPLLDRVRINPRAVPSPVIDGISDASFAYTAADAGIRGGFTWQALMFRWIPVPQYEKKRLKSPTDAVRTPTMAGGLFSIRKDFFYQLGTYDPGLQIWGGENIELSFKVWMCGGSLEISPCSHVAHVFRAKQPYSFPGGDNISMFIRNSLRVATVWLDEYLEAFFNVQPQLRTIDTGNVTDRINLKKSLQCKSFGWYLKNVYPELVVPGFRLKASGEVENVGTKLCLDAMAGFKSRAGVIACHGQGGNQYFRLTENDKLEVGDKCIVSWSNTIKGMTCVNADQTKWEHIPGGHMKDSSTGLCLDVMSDLRNIVLTDCKGTNTQKWSFSNYKRT